jgi:hypothetical protein
MSETGEDDSIAVSHTGPLDFGENFPKKVRKHIDQIRNRGPVREGILAPGKSGIKRVEEIVRERVAQGGGRATTFAGAPALAFEDGAVTYVTHPDGRFWTVLSDS